MIVYNDLYEALRKERYSEQLQDLPKNFIKDISEYFNEKRQLTEKKEDMFSEAIIKSKKQFENAVSIFKELMLRRKKKLLNLAFIASETGISKRDFENMLEFEKKLFETIMDSMEQNEKDVTELLNGKRGEKEKNNVLVVFLQDVDEFLGLEGESLGPFKRNNLANLPKQIVEILLADKKVELVEE